MTRGTDADEAARFRRQAAAMNQELLLAAVRQHELIEAGERLSAELRAEIAERKRAECCLQAMKKELESRVAERTAELAALAEELKAELRMRVESERDLAQSEARFRTLVEDSPVGTLIVQDGRIVFRNPEQEKLFGPIPEGMKLEEFRDIHTEDAGRFAALCEAVREGMGRVSDIPLRVVPFGMPCEGAGTVWVHVRTTPIEYQGRDATLVAMVDVTRVKSMEQIALRQEKMASLGLVAAGMAHEIRNPLSGLNIHLSAAEQLFEGMEGLRPETRETALALIGTAKAASDKVEGVIKRMMNFTRTSPLRLVPSRINEAVQEAVDLAAATLCRNGILLEARLAEGLPSCRADLRLLAQVVLNLIMNAVQVLEDAEGVRKIGIATALEDGHVVVRVADSGPGVPAHLREKIFEAFYTTRSGGTGIGLFFSHEVVTGHAGSLEVATGSLGGAEFLVRIPAMDR